MALKYFVEPDAEHPRYLARVDNLRVSEVISKVYPTWTWHSPATALAWDSSGLEVTREQAAKIAEGWGSELEGPSAGPVAAREAWEPLEDGRTGASRAAPQGV